MGMNFADKAIVNILAKASRPFLMIFSGIVMVRVLSKDDYGTYLQAMLIVNTLLMFTFCGIPQSMYYFIPQQIHKARFLLRNNLVTLLIAFVSGGVIFLLMDFIANWFSNSKLVDMTILISLIIFFKAPSMMREPLLVSFGKLKKNAQLNILCNVIVYVPLVVSAMIFPCLSVIMMVMVLSSFIEFVVYYIVSFFLIREELKKEVFLDKKYSSSLETISFIQQFRYAFPIGASTYLSTLGRQFDQFIISIFFVPSDFAVYSRGAMKVPILSSMSQIVNNMMMPHYVQCIKQNNNVQFLKSYHSAIDKIAKINFPVFFFLFAIAPALIISLYTEQYAGAISIFRAYLFLLLLSITVYGIIPRVTGHTKVLFYATMLGVLSNIVLSVTMIKFLGAVGAAIATIISSLFSALFLLLFSSHLLNISFSRIFPWNNIAKQLIVSLVASIPLYGFSIIPFNSTSWFVSQIILCAVIYFLSILYLFGRFNILGEDDLEYLSNRLPSWLVRLIFRIIPSL